MNKKDKKIKSDLGSLVRGSKIVFLGNIFSKILNFFFQLLLSNTLGAIAYGRFSLGLSLLEISQTFSGAGLTHGIVYFGARYKASNNLSKLKGLIISTLGLAFILGVIFSFFLIINSDYLANSFFKDSEMMTVVKFFAFALPFIVVTSICSKCGRAFEKMHYDIGLSGIIQPALILVFCGISLYYLPGLSSALSAYLIACIVISIIGIYFVARIFPEIYSKINASFEVKTLLRYSLPTFGASLAVLFIANTDKLMLGYFVDAKAVGIYNAAALLAIQVTFVLKVLSASFPPMISRLYHQGKLVELGELYTATCRWIITPAILIVLILCLNSSFLMSLFGDEFTIGRIALIILAIAYLIDAASGCSGYMLIMTGRQDLELINNCLVAILNFVLNLILIPYYGIEGASIASGFSLILVNLVRTLEVKILLSYFPYDIYVLKAFISGFSVVLIFFIINQLELSSPIKTWQSIPLIIIMYCFFIFFLRVHPDDRKHINRLVKF